MVVSIGPMRRNVVLLLAASLTVASYTESVSAQDAAPGEAPGEAQDAAAGEPNPAVPASATPASVALAAEVAPTSEPAQYGSTIVGTRSREAIVEDHRAVTVVDEQALEELAPRSTSAALHLLPGVSVQRTNHAGGSAFVRGLTGQQTLLLIDGFRLSTSIARSGPNQYLNTIDVSAIDRIEVLRGSGSVLYGSDAIGGVVSMLSRAPAGQATSAALELRGGTADRSAAARAEVSGAVGKVRMQFGATVRSVGDLRGAGPLALTEVPVYDGETQLFTGYDERSADAKVSRQLGTGELTAAVLAFRQLDAPRTDKCSPDPLDCRFFDEQFYDLTYLKYAGRLGKLEEVDLGAMVGRTHERRSRVREARDQVTRARDRVLTLGLTSRASLPTWRSGESALRISFGGEAYRDGLDSEASTQTISTGETAMALRGKYLDGSTYTTVAGFVFGELVVDPSVSFTAGVRLTHVRANIAADPEGGTAGFTHADVVPVAGVGARVRVAEGMHIVANIDRAFRAPNLDDLTARSSEGPGFQIPNAALEPEIAVSIDAGVVVKRRQIELSLFAFQTYIDGAIQRVATTCPTGSVDMCGDADNIYRLANADSASTSGLELAFRAHLPAGVHAGVSASYTRGTVLIGEDDGVPMSKIPPLGGRTWVRFDIRDGLYYVETIADFAMRQDRLSPADGTDRRIPTGGTPGYGILHVRAGARLGPHLRAHATLENLTNSPYRVHGSGVDGARFGIFGSVRGEWDRF